jgi:putative MFS transporter
VQESHAATADLADQAPLSGSYFIALGLLTFITVFDYFDFSVIGFLGSTIARENHLTYGQLSAVVVAAGVGTIVGSLVSGELSDRYGRRLAIVMSTALCGLSSLCILLVPTGAWITLALLRVLVGIGIAGASTPTMALAVEYTPPRHRTLLTSLPVIGATGGALTATASITILVAKLHWRGVAALGIAPAFAGLALLMCAPESPLWLLARGRKEDARRAMARLQGLRVDTIPLPAAGPRTDVQHVPFREVFRDPRRVCLTLLLWGGTLMATSGVYLWGPTLVGSALQITAAATARIFMGIAIAGLAGKIIFSFVPRLLGRRRTNELGCFFSAAVLVAAAVFHARVIGGTSALVMLLIVGAVFFDGVIANLAPYTVEIYPTRLAARGYALGQAANGAAKILAPAALATLAGAGNYVAASGSARSLTPSLLLMSACVLVSGIASVLMPTDSGSPKET